MKRITISLPDDVSAAVEREARRRRTSVSQVIRERLEAPAGGSGSRRISFAGVGLSGHHDTARRADEILAREWAKSPESAKLPSKVRARSR